MKPAKKSDDQPSEQQPTIQVYAHSAASVTREQLFHSDVMTGMNADRRWLPPRWFYDRRGSELFEAITHLTEYYPARTEIRILKEAASAIAALVGTGRSIVEFGSGSSTKTPILLSAIEPSVYVPVDISGEFLQESAATLGRSFPDLPIRAVAGDFTRPLVLPDEIQRKPRLGFFAGSTLGNFDPAQAVDLLRSMAVTLGEGAMLLIGLDRIKDPEILIAAYDDSDGVTAAFNLNLLERINRELAGTIPVEAFRHLALWNDDDARIEMRLQAMRDVCFAIGFNRFSMKSGETLHTENSYKYRLGEAKLLLRAGGWTPIEHWTDEHEWFSVILASESHAGA